MHERIGKSARIATLCLSFACTASSLSTVSAQQAVTVCTGTSTTTYSPGVVLLPRSSTLTWTDNYTACISSTSGIDSADSAGGSYTAVLSCLDVLSSGPAAGSQRIDWSNGDYSVIAWDIEDVVVETILGTSVVVVNATVTEGLYLGQTVVETRVDPELNQLACLSEPGITQSTAVITLSVLPL